MKPSDRARAERRVWATSGGVCHRCGRPGADTIDHVLALSEGGADVEANLAPIHQKPCHDTKTAEESARAKARRRPGR